MLHELCDRCRALVADPMTWPREVFSIHLDGTVRGYVQRELDDSAALWRQAVRNVHAAAEMPERDRAADERRAERSAAYWSARRGESRPQVEGFGGGS